jgi:hypothetical protein
MIGREEASFNYPASFRFVASMSPCPCGYHNHPDNPCVDRGRREMSSSKEFRLSTHPDRVVHRSHAGEVHRALEIGSAQNAQHVSAEDYGHKYVPPFTRCAIRTNQ